MNLRKHSRSIASALGALVLLPLACERSDHDVVRGGGDGDGASTGGGNLGGQMGDGDGDGDGAGGSSTGGVTFTTGGAASGGMLNLPNPLLDTCSALGGMGGVPSVGDADGPLLIDDFEDGNNRIWGNGLSGRWESHNDGTEGGTQSPLGGFHFPESTWTDGAFDTGRTDTNSLHMTGNGFDTWGSGQSVYFAQDGEGLACLFDATEYAGVTFWARGSVTLVNETDPFEQPKPVEHNKVRVKVVDLDVIANGGDELEPGATAGGRCDQEKFSCWDSPLSRIQPADCWQKYVLPFDDMEADEWSKWKGEGITTLDSDEIFQLVFEVSELQNYELWFDDIEFYTSDDVPTEVMGCD